MDELPCSTQYFEANTDRQSEHTIQMLEDMLRACVIDFGGSWNIHLPLAKFSYNNSYHSSIRCAHFEALYGRKYRVRLKAARDRQKSYADNRMKCLEFQVGDHKCLTDANFHVLLDEIKVDKILRFVKEPLEIMDHEVRTLKRSKTPIMKVRWNSKRRTKFTWEREDHMKAKYPQLFENANVETNG
nr:hypothetical protein [Tanacetum cinerariifolium]